MHEIDERLRTAFANHYSIHGELGRGGMAVVYLAHDLKHDRDVAIKVLHPDLAAALGGDRFLSEIRTTAKLQHPHILPLLDSGAADGLLYYVMPVVTGETLRVLLDNKRQLSITDAVRIAREVASALDYAHRHGVIHRDIKPENILLHDGQAVVADFGIALAVQQAGGQRITQTGLSLGTPQYMSPEQAMGEKAIDARADIYALSAVTYEMLVGEPPFTGPTVQAIVAKTMTEKPVSPRAMRDTIPPGLEHAILTGLAKLPADRFASAAEFATALTAERGPAEHMPVRERAFAGGRVSVAVAWTATVCAVLLAAWAWRRPASDGGPATRVAVALPDSQRIVPQWRGYSVGVSHDGTRLAYVGAGPTRSTTQVWVRRLDALEATAVANTVGATTVRWAPDGHSLLFSYTAATSDAAVVNVDGGQVTPVPGAYDGDVGASGRVYSVRQPNYLVRQAPGGALDTVVRVGVRQPLTLSVTPDESTVLVSLVDSVGIFADAQLAAVSLASGKVTNFGRGVFAQYLTSGHLLYVSAGGDVFVAPFDLRKVRFTGPATPVARVAFNSNSGVLYPQISASNNGTLVYLTGEIQRQRLTWLDASGHVAQRLPSEGNFWGVALSPDGSRVALASRHDDRIPGGRARGVGNVAVEDLRTGTRTQLSASDFNVRPSWSADGKYVLYTRVGGPMLQALLERRADASEPERVVLSRKQFSVHSVGDGRWLPDHRTLIVRTYSDVASGSRDIFYLSSGDTTPRPVAATSADETSPAPSPDGSMIAYNSNETGTAELYVQPFPNGQGRLQVSHGGSGPSRWSRDGKLYYWDNRNRLTAVTLQSRPSLAITNVRDIGGDVVPSAAGGGATQSFDVAPDGRVLVAEQVREAYTLVLVRNWIRGTSGQ